VITDWGHGTQPSAVEGPPADHHIPVSLLIADEFTVSDSDLEEETNHVGIFDQVAVYDDMVIDEYGNEVMFSTGDRQTDESRERLQREIDALEYNSISLG